MAAVGRTEVDLSDLGRALRQLAGDVELLQDFVETFLENVSTRLDALERAVAAGDARGVADQARALRGRAGHFRGEGFARSAEELEALAASDSLAAAGALLESLQGEFRSLRDRLMALDWRFIGSL